MSHSSAAGAGLAAGGADRLVYVAATGRFIGPAGAAETPGQVGLARFLTRPGLAPADALALYAQGVRWTRAEMAGA